jgi:hypothetical protein
VTVSATNEHRISTSKTVTVFVAPPSCVYPQSNTIRRSIREKLRAIEENKDKCASFYLDTLEGHSNPCIFGDPLCVEGKDHHQGLARNIGYRTDLFTSSCPTLGGHPKSGHTRSLQNRPTGTLRDRSFLADGRTFPQQVFASAPPLLA